MSSPTLKKWFPHRRPSPAARARLFCFTYAGGSAAAFRAWADSLGPAIEVCAVEPPGRGSRFVEPPYRHAEAYVAAVLPLVRELSDRPFVLFGHSLGAMVAFEVAQSLERSGARTPAAIALSGHGLDDVREPPIHELPTPQLIERLKRYDGTPPDLLDNAELMELVLPTLRADFELGARHEYRLGTKLKSPILAIGGRQDSEVPQASLAKWGEQTTQFALRMFEGRHFYLHEAEREVITVLRELVDRVMQGRTLEGLGNT
jgi:medium-chain acyl-[acyl-carrier-protein] hydrolase